MMLFSLRHSRAFRRALIVLGGAGLLMMLLSFMGSADGHRDAHAAPVAERTIFVVKRMADGGTGPDVNIALDGNSLGSLGVSVFNAGLVLTPSASAGEAHSITESGLAAGYALDGYKVIQDPLPPTETDKFLRADLCFSDKTTPLTGLTSTASIPDDGNNYVVCVQNARRTIFVVKRMADGGTGPAVNIALDGNSLGSLGVSTFSTGPVLTPLATPGVAHTITESGLAPGYVLDGFKVIPDPLPQSESSSGLRHDLCFAGNPSPPLTGLTATATIPADGKNYVVCVQNARRTIFVVKRMADGGSGPDVNISLDGNSLGSLAVSTFNTVHVLPPLATPGVAHTITESGLAPGYVLDGFKVIPDPLPQSETNSGLRHDLCFADNTSPPLTGLTPTATIPADGKNYVVCIQNARRTVFVVKRMADGGTGPDVNIALDGNSLGSLGVSTFSTGPVLTPLATPGVAHTITESGLAPGYALDGFKVIPDPLPQSESSSGLRHDLCFAENSPPLTGLTSTANIPADGKNYIVCVQNVVAGTLTINKHVIANPKLIENGSFNLTVDGVTKAAGVADGGTTGPLYLHSGTYTVGETSAGGPDLTHYTSSTVCVNAAGAPVANPVVLASGDNVTCTITNTRIILDPLQLLVRKWDDPAANLTGTGGPVAGFVMTITGTSGPALGHTYSMATDGTGGAALFDNIEEGSWIVSEPASPAHWTVIGSTANGANPDFDASRDEPANQVTTAEGTTPYVDFYNQRLVNIHAFKLEVAAGGTTNGAGWAITVKGCGVNQTQPTAADGTADFVDLPLCPSGYTVSENPLGKPGFLPAGPTSTLVHAVTPGATYTVGFENVQIIVGCASGCAPAVQPPVTAPSPTATPPAPTPTSPPPATPIASATAPAQPSPTDVVLGAKTPGPVTAATPIAPSTGTGTNGGDDPVPVLLFLAGVLAVAGGLAVTLAARRSREG